MTTMSSPGISRRQFWSASTSASGAGGSIASSTSNNNPITQAWSLYQLKRLEKEANMSLNDAEIQYQFLTELAKHYPTSVIERMRHPAFKTASINIESSILFIQLLQQQNRLQLLDADDIIKRLNSSIPNVSNEWKQYQQEVHYVQHDGGSERKFTKPELAQQLYSFLLNGATAAGAAAATATTSLGRSGAALGHGGNNPFLLGATSTPGISAKNPVHVQVVTGVGGGSPTLLGGVAGRSAAIIGFVSRVALYLLAFSAIGAFLDDKGIGRGMAGVGGSSKHVQEADADGTTNGSKKKVKFDDVKGVQEAKAELEEIVMYLKDPSKFTRLGGTLPRGLLLTGPPGTGKTLLAKAIAGEADVPFFYSSGSQFEEVYVGLGAKRIRELFEAAKKKAPAIIFIDEIDAVGGTRKLKDQSALKMTLNELLVQLDGFDENNGIIVIGATNFMESLDTALLRPGRFDKHVVVPLPDVGGRKEILEMYAKKTKLSADADLNVLARGTTGMSGADLYNLINQAALKASIDGLASIDMRTLEYAKDKILMGAERKTAVITAETAKTTAYHEAGHAIVAVLTEGAMPIHKATIMPRGTALGMVTMLPENDQTSQSYKEMMAFMDIAMGGRVAEELIFGKENITSGASSDIQMATRLARNMVTKFGFSDAVGIVFHGGSNGEESASNETRALIDSEVKKLTDSSYKRAKEILGKHHMEHQLLAETLLEYETLTGDEVRQLIYHHIKPKRPVINKNSGARGDPNLMLTTDRNSSSTSKETSSSTEPPTPPTAEDGGSNTKKKKGLFASLTKRE